MNVDPQVTDSHSEYGDVFDTDLNITSFVSSSLYRRSRYCTDPSNVLLLASARVNERTFNDDS